MPTKAPTPCDQCKRLECQCKDTRHNLYSSRWKRLRLAFLTENPCCYDCLSRGVTRAATEVHHITKHEGNLSLFWDVDNLMAACKPCHSARTARGE